MGIFNRKNNGPLIPEVQSEGQTAQYAPRQGQGQSQYAARDQRPSGGASAYHTNGQNMRSSGRDQAPVFHVEGHNLAPPPYSSGGNGQSLARGSSRGSDPYNAAFGASNGSGSFGRTSSHGSGGGGGGRDPYARTNSNGSGNDAAHNELLRGADRGDRSGSDPYANRGGNNANSSSSPYDRPGASVEDAARNELFAGMQPNQKQVQATRQYGYDGREHEEDFDEEEEIEGIKQDMRRTKQDSLASTRNTLQTARQAEETARNTMGLLGDQSGEFLSGQFWQRLVLSTND
jgi:hypothetical protein